MKPKLGIIAGSGLLPGLVIKACLNEGRDFYVVAIKGFADPNVVGDVNVTWLRLGRTGTGFKLLKKRKIKQVVMIGGVKRPSLRDLLPDLTTLFFFARLKSRALGDDGLLRELITEFEKHGIEVIGVQNIIKDCVAPVGIYGSVKPDEQALTDIAQGFKAARYLGELDIGQSVIVQQGFVLGVEACEGTDELISRCVPLYRKGATPILVKARKVTQDSRVDLPTIGVDTIKRMTKAGLRGVAIEAGQSLIVDMQEMVMEADKAGIFIMGLLQD